MYDYGIQKETTGWSVWALAPHTGDRRDFIADKRNKRDALRCVDVLRANASRRASITKD